MVMGPRIASLVFWALKSLHCAHVLGPKIASLVFWALKSLLLCDFWAQNRQDGAHVQKNTNGGVVYMSLYKVVSRRLYP